MPRHDQLGRFSRVPGRRSSLMAYLARRALIPKRKPPRRPEQDGVPVEPNSPTTLSGGAAAPLTFEGDRQAGRGDLGLGSQGN